MQEQDLHDYIAEIYKERNKFIIIGLAGYTGAGCSTVASLFASEFNELKAPNPKNNNYCGKDDRSYAVLYDYAKDNWKKFTIISASSVIVTFISEQAFSTFKNFVLKELSNTAEAIDKVDAIPSQTGNSGKLLTTDGSVATWTDAVKITLRNWR